jgi:hypothetical protein
VVFHPGSKTKSIIQGSKTKSIIQNDFWLRPVAIHFLWRAPGRAGRQVKGAGGERDGR